METASPWQLPSAIRVSMHPRWKGCIFFFLTLLSNFFTAGTRSLQPWCGDVYKDHQPLGERKHSSMRECH